MVWILKSEDETKAVSELNAISPRAVAIVAVAILEDRIGALIAARFPVEGKIKTQLFKATGPLGNLDTKIKMGYTLGILSKDGYQDMVNICEVRNKFAHRLEIFDFEHEDVSKLCMGLKLVEKHVFPYGMDIRNTPGVSPKMFEKNLQEQLSSPRRRYLLAVRLITSALTSFPTVGGKPPPPVPLI